MTLAQRIDMLEEVVLKFLGSSAKEEALQRYLIKTLEKYREKTANERKRQSLLGRMSLVKV